MAPPQLRDSKIQCDRSADKISDCRPPGAPVVAKRLKGTMDSNCKDKGSKRADDRIQAESRQGGRSGNHPQDSGGQKLKNMESGGDQGQLGGLTNPRGPVV